MRRKQLFLFFAVYLVCLSSFVYSQDGGGDASSKQLLESSSKDLILVGAMGGSGAIIGLSTLSFAEHPGEHLKNITIGASIGVILGVAMVAYNQATKTQESYGLTSSVSDNEKYFDLKQKEMRSSLPQGRKEQNIPLVYLSHTFNF